MSLVMRYAVFPSALMKVVEQKALFTHSWRFRVATEVKFFWKI